MDFSFLIRCMNFILVLHIELPIFFQFFSNFQGMQLIIWLHILVNIVWKLEFLSQAVFEQNFNIKLCWYYLRCFIFHIAVVAIEHHIWSFGRFLVPYIWFASYSCTIVLNASPTGRQTQETMGEEKNHTPLLSRLYCT